MAVTVARVRCSGWLGVAVSMEVVVCERLDSAAAGAKLGAVLVPDMITLLHATQRSAPVEAEQNCLERISKHGAENLP